MSSGKVRVYGGVVAAAGTSVVLALTGCGSDDGAGAGSGGSESGGPQREDAVKAMRTVESVHAVGKTQWVAEPAQIDLRMDREGNCVGSVSNDDDLEFSAFDEPVKVEAPPADSVPTEEQVSDIQMASLS